MLGPFRSVEPPGRGVVPTAWGGKFMLLVRVGAEFRDGQVLHLPEAACHRCRHTRTMPSTRLRARGERGNRRRGDFNYLTETIRTQRKIAPIGNTPRNMGFLDTPPFDTSNRPSRVCTHTLSLDLFLDASFPPFFGD